MASTDPGLPPTTAAAALDSSDTPTGSEKNLAVSDTEKQVAKPGPPPGVGPPPNGGTLAWLQVLGSFFLNVNTWGLLNTFGIFQAEYSNNILTSSSESSIAWIGSVQAFLMLVVGVLCGRALDAGYYWPDILLGVFFEVFGMMMTSISSQYWQIMLAQGICVGIGAGMAFMPSVAIVGTYFSTRRSTAMGITATGSSIGGIIYPIVLKRLIQDIGFRWAVRVMAFIMLGTLLISVAVMRPRLPPRKSGPLVNWGNLVDPVFVMWLAAVFLSLLGLYTPFFYVEQYALSIGVDADMAFYMLMIMNTGSVPGRVFPGMVADKIGTLAIMIPAVILSGVIMLAWKSVQTQASLIAASFFFGLTSGSVQAVLPATVAFLRPDLSQLGTNLGMTLFSAGIGLLVGTPVAGAIVDHQSSKSGTIYWGAFVFSGVAAFLGGLLLCAVRVMKVGFTFAKA